jgi:kynurenine formamidase
MIIDLTHAITPDTPVYPGSPIPAMTPFSTLTQNGCRETRLNIGSHTGTHMDAPAHVLTHGSTLDDLPMSQFCGRAVVLDVSDFAPGQTITADFLRARNEALMSADFALFYTGWEKKWGTSGYYDDTFPVPDLEAAKYLVSCGLKGIGLDTFGPDRLSTTEFPIHKLLLTGGLVIVENLCLKKLLGRKDIMLFALPLKYQNADGAPVRAIAEFRDFSEKETEQA